MDIAEVVKEDQTLSTRGARGPCLASCNYFLFVEAANF